MRLRWLVVALPAGIGVLISLWILISDTDNPIFYAQAAVSDLIFILGFGLSLLVGVILVIWDRIENIEINAIISSADDRRRFLRRLDHELKNPLTAILAGLANLAVAETHEGRTEALSSVQSQVSRLRRLSAELRKLSELETRQLDRGPVEMSELLQEAYLIAQEIPEAADRNMDLSIPHAPWPLPTISGDHDLLTLAVHNLLDNAIKFTHSGDYIEMRAFEDGSQVVIEVADTGPGIPEDEIPHVWEELYRGDGARGVQGSGLGLALVRAIILRHAGKITLRSRPGEGTVFSIRLPN